MSVYGNATTMSQLVTAMRDKARQDTTHLSYLRLAEVAYPPLQAFTAEPALFIIPEGTEENVIGESRLKRGIHHVAVQCLIYTASPEKETLLLGNNREVGLLQFVGDVMAFYNNNTLGLTGLEANLAPTITSQPESYTLEPTDDNRFVAVCKLAYEATTKPFAK